MSSPRPSPSSRRRGARRAGHTAPTAGAAGRELAPFIMIVDSRERLPYSFAGLAREIRRGLPAGDYSIVGHETSFAVERKSIADAYSTFSTGRARFERELAKLRAYERAAILIEGSLDDVLAYRPAHANVARVKPATVLKSLLSWYVEFNVVPLFGSIDRSRCRALVFYLAERFWWRKHPGGGRNAPETVLPPEARDVDVIALASADPLAVLDVPPLIFSPSSPPPEGSAS